MCQRPFAEWSQKGEAFYKRSFLFREHPTGAMASWIRYLCPKCSAKFSSDAARDTFLESTLPPHIKVGDELQVPVAGSGDPDRGSGAAGGSR